MVGTGQLRAVYKLTKEKVSLEEGIKSYQALDGCRRRSSYRCWVSLKKQKASVLQTWRECHQAVRGIGSDGGWHSERKMEGRQLEFKLHMEREENETQGGSHLGKAGFKKNSGP